MKIMFDMDGVLCDFAYWVEYNHAWDDNNPNIKERKVNWDKLKEIGSSFWAEMPWLLDGKKLYDLVLEYTKDCNNVEIGIHSAINIPCGKSGKYDWIRKNCPLIDMKNVKIDEDGCNKHIMGAIDEILIDDREENVKTYIEEGFPAILFTTAGDTFMNLIKHINQ